MKSFSQTRRGALALAASGVAALAVPVVPARAQMKLRIGAIGAGRLGGAVGALWVKAGHEVMFSSRNPAELKGLVAELGPNARAGTVAEAISFGDAVLLAVPYAAYPEVGSDHGPALRGKVVMDAGNANFSDLFERTKRDGVGVTTASFFPEARIVRAFNAANNRLFTENAGRNPRMAIPIAGDDQAAIEVVKGLVVSAGFEPLVVGGLREADRFAMGGPGFGHVLPARELAEKLGVKL